MSENEKAETVVEETGELPVADFNYIMSQTQDEFQWVNVPEWNCRVKVKSLNKAEQTKMRLASSVRGQVDETKMEMNVLVYGLVEPRLTFHQVDELFATGNAKAISRIQSAILVGSGLTEDYVGEAEANMKR